MILAAIVIVFKTSVKNKLQVKKLKPHIDKILPKESWNFDLDDCDKILRVESETIPMATGIGFEIYFY